MDASIPVGPAEREEEMTKREQDEGQRKHARDSDHLAVQDIPPFALFHRQAIAAETW